MNLIQGTFFCPEDNISHYYSGNNTKRVVEGKSILGLIRSLTFLNLEKGPWVAGGAVRRLLFDLPFSGDIDIFLGDDSPPLAALRAELRNHPDVIMCEDNSSRRLPTTTNFLMTSLPEIPKVKIQLVHRHFASLNDLLDDFDYTICMAATDGFSWIADERLFAHHSEKRLVVHNNKKRSFQAARLMKYCGYGFTPDPGVITDILHFDDLEFSDSGFVIVDNGDDY